MCELRLQILSVHDLQSKKRHGDGGPGEASYGSYEPSQEECLRDEDMLGEYFSFVALCMLEVRVAV